MSVFVRSEHEQKYDRQTRIWGSHGQVAIETSHICVLGSSATASEALKSLILPNVQHFTVVDDKLVDDNDLETNFFVETEDRGKPRAEAVVRHVSELNPDAKGIFVVKNPSQAFKENPEFFKAFQLVIACQMTDADVLPLAEFLYANNIPFMNVKSYGLIGSLRIAVPELLVVETHYENDRVDLFLHPDHLAHFPELAAYCNSFNIDTEETHIHSHIPYVAILVKLAERWRATHDGNMPSTYAEQKAFKEFIIQSSLDFGQEENFEEAHKFAHRVYRKRDLDDEVKEVFDHAHCNNLTPNSPNFWVMARAVRDFYQNEGHGMLPASSDIPDMTTTSESFVALKDIFSRKAAADLGAVTTRVQQLLGGLGKPTNAVPANEIEYFVKNIRGIRQLTFRSLAEEHTPASFPAATLNEIIEEEEFHEDESQPPPPKDVFWYIALRAAEQFHAQYGRYPGTGAIASLEQEQTAFGVVARTFMDQYGISGAVADSVIQETVRFGASELHTVASVLGAVAAQEGLKIILRQFIPVNNTFIYNGIHGKQLALQL